MASKLALGKGLGALIGSRPSPPPIQPPADTTPTGGDPASSAAPPVEPGERVRMVALSQVVPSPLQPRKRFDTEHLLELMESIREHGIIQPLIVREVRGKLELIAGERRFRASSELKLAEVPVIVREASDRDVLEMALIENLQREDLNAIEEALAYRRLADEFAMKHEEIAARVGKNRATVSNAMRLLDLDGEVQGLVAQGLLSVGHAKVILGLKTHAEQRLAADVVVRKGLTVRATDQYIADQLNRSGKKAKPEGGSAPAPKQSAEIIEIQNRLRDHLSTNVSLHHGDKKGKIEIEYYGNDDLGRVLAKIGIKEF
ncbi:MAG: ParB/RepB/Spo0J family partition protein [Verrucomicrobiales bacterium]